VKTGPVVEVPERCADCRTPLLEAARSHPEVPGLICLECFKKREDHCELCDDSMITNSGIHGVGHCVQREAVIHPPHYGGDVPHEVWRCLHAWGLENDAILWNVVKYVARAGKKHQSLGLEDLKKARFYLQNRIDSLEEA